MPIRQSSGVRCNVVALRFPTSAAVSREEEELAKKVAREAMAI
jgi:hypothetical protein